MDAKNAPKIKKQTSHEDTINHPMYDPWIAFNDGPETWTMVSYLDESLEARGLNKLNPKKYYWPEAPHRRELKCRPGGHVQLLHSYYKVFAENPHSKVRPVVTKRSLKDL